MDIILCIYTRMWRQWFCYIVSRSVENLENNSELYDLTKRILIDGKQFIFNPLDLVISIGITHGIFKNGVEISNKIIQSLTF